jgi:single-strand DNA-binding protein
MGRGRQQPGAEGDTPEALSCNDVRIVGRLSKPAVEREMPSGDPLVTFVVVVDRPAGRRVPEGTRPQTIDSLDCVAWTAATRRRARTLDAGDVVEVIGAVRRRFWSAGVVKASRYEVEASSIRRVARRS